MDLAEALDRIALQKLVWAYCHAIDRRDLALVRSLYHDDAVDDHGAMFCGSADEYVAWLPSMLANWQATSHVIQTMNFLIAGDEAEGELVTMAWHRTADGSRDIIAHGRYLDRYLKRDGAWKFHRRSLVFDWSEERAVESGSGTVDDGVEHGRPGSDDPVYARLPLFRRQREAREA
jgi:ketosteroid isomerase-like protein